MNYILIIIIICVVICLFMNIKEYFCPENKLCNPCPQLSYYDTQYSDMEKCSNCKKILEEDFTEEEFHGELLKFCSDKCASEYEKQHKA